MATSHGIERPEYGRYQTQNMTQTLPKELNWWSDFQEDQLTRLVERGLENSPSVQQAQLRLAQAFSSKIIANSALYPSADLNYNQSQNYADSDREAVSLGLAASYELDLWGKNQANSRAAQETIRREEWLLQSTRLTLSAEIATSWVLLSSLAQKITILEQQILVNKDVLTLQEKRFLTGTASALDVLQQEELIASVRAQLPKLKSDYQVEQNRLAVLLGEIPETDQAITDFDQLDINLQLDAYDLYNLQERPDIAASWQENIIQNYQIDQAMAERLPSLRLSTLGEFSGVALRSLTESWIVTLAGAIALPIFDAGQRKAQVELEKLRLEENLSSYKQTVLEAIEDLQNADTQYKYQKQTLDLIEKQFEASNRSLSQAQASYLAGDASYLNVLTALTSLQSLERNIVDAKRDVLLQKIAFYRAIGGVIPSEKVGG